MRYIFLPKTFEDIYIITYNHFIRTHKRNSVFIKDKLALTKIKKMNSKVLPNRDLIILYVHIKEIQFLLKTN